MPDPTDSNDSGSNGSGAPPDAPATDDAGAPAGNGGAGVQGPLEQEIAQLTSLLIHLKADFDNYKKRSQKEIASGTRIGELDAVRKFLPVFANLERALAAAKGASEGSALTDGVRQIHDQLQKTLSGMGIERVPAVGVPFDPALHEAVAAAPRSDVAPGTVTDEFEPGYKADGRALIPAKVRVSTAE